MKTVGTIIIKKIGEVDRRGRVFSLESVNQIIDQFNERQTKRPNRSTFGEVKGAVNDPYSDRFVDLRKVGYEIKKMYIDGSDFKADVEFLENTLGELAKFAVDQNSYKCIVRAYGTVNEDNSINVSEFITVDMTNKQTTNYESLEGN